MINEQDLLLLLKKNLIQYKIHNHKAFFTVNESETSRGLIKGSHTKNLFLKNKKNNFFLFSCHEKTKVNLKLVGKSLKIGNLSFAKENQLKKFLNLNPGSVTPFGLLNDLYNNVSLYLDFKLITFEQINFHPLINTSTITLKTKDFISFLHENKKKVNIYDFENYSLK